MALATSRAAEIRPSDHWESAESLEFLFFTLPWATSSFWATEAALIRAEDAVAMDFADSMMSSSKVKFSVLILQKC